VSRASVREVSPVSDLRLEDHGGNEKVKKVDFKSGVKEKRVVYSGSGDNDDRALSMVVRP